jgi:hypothetical protein
MDVAELLDDAFGRVKDVVHQAVEGLDGEHLALRPAPGANTIAWLVWHLTRVHDDHVSEVAGREQVWTAQGWADRFDLPFDDDATGFGMTADEVGQVRVDGPGLLIGYLDAVHDQTAAYLATLTPEDLDRVVDESWDPPVTLGVRLVSVIGDTLQHAGQAAYVRGLLS